MGHNTKVLKTYNKNEYTRSDPTGSPTNNVPAIQQMFSKIGGICVYY